MSELRTGSPRREENAAFPSRRVLAQAVGASLALAALSLTSAQTASASPADAADTPTTPAQAPSGGTPEAAPEEVVVTGSRITRTGFTTPTPVTVVGLDDINVAARPNIADVINIMPSVRPSLTSSSTTNQSLVGGGNFIDLRGLGEVRTLTLIDGKRFVPANRYGDVDLNAIPQALIGGIDIVTGGASAAYGSNAVSGVVNLRLDHELEGFRGSLQGGETDHHDNRNYLGSFAYGTKFADSRGKVLLGAEFSDNDGVGNLYSRSWGRNHWGIITNPNATASNGQPKLLLTPGVVSSNFTPGGVITSGPLKGIQFGPGGQPIPFYYGQDVSSTTMVGGSGFSTDVNQLIESPLQRKAAYGRVSFAFNEAVTAYVELNYADSSSTVPSNVVPTDQITIQRDNAYLPASIGAAMNRLGITSFTLGRIAEDYSHEVYSPDYRTKRAVLGFEGSFGDGWKWDGYYTHGETNQIVHWTNRDTANFNQAVDAVVNPATGGIVCRSTLTNPNNGCQPADLFGAGSVSAAAMNYMVVPTYIGTNVKQDAADASVQGEPFTTWAGPVSLAVGAAYRKESTEIIAGPLSAAGALYDANQTPWSGSVSDTEEFVEGVIPLAKGMTAIKEFDLNLAARRTDYNTSGTVATWKGGVTYAVNDIVRLRATRSRDIRAPNANELFALGGQVGHFPIIDPLTNSTSPSVAVFSNGNPALQPEKADTTTAGFVLSPVSHLNLSLDYWDIQVHGAIISLGPQTIVDQCYAGAASLCNAIHRDGSGQISTIQAVPENLQQQHIRGEDFELSYLLPLVPGNLSFHVLANHIDTITLQGAGSYLQLAGSMEQPTVQSIGGQPHWRGNVTTTYTNGALTLSATARYVGGGMLRDEWTSANINQLTSGSRTYLDLFIQRDLIDNDNTNLQLFASVVNATNLDPPVTGQGGLTTRALYDMIGRTYTAGVRFKF